MRKWATADRTVCRNFCRYFNPAKSADQMCQGYLVVQRLIAGGKRLSQAKPNASAFPARAGKELRARVCAACSFHDADCDYILTGGNASPCGGFVLLSRLLGTGELTPEEIGGAVDPAAYERGDARGDRRRERR